MIILKNNSEIEGINRSCEIVAYVLKELEKEVKPGTTTNYLDKMAEELCMEKGGTPGFKGYRGFPYSICASKNDRIVHGFPDDVPLRSGDILSIDFGVLYKGWYGDSALTIPVGEVSPEVSKLLYVGKECLDIGINILQGFVRVGDISHVIQTHAEDNGFSVVKEFVGHGIGRNLHEEPQIPNWGDPHTGSILKAGTVIAIEPMVNMGSPDTVTLADGWTTATKDSKPSVHFEHTIAITESGPKVLTYRY